MIVLTLYVDGVKHFGKVLNNVGPFYFCSDECRQRFANEQYPNHRYKMDHAVREQNFGVCDECGEEIERR